MDVPTKTPAVSRRLSYSALRGEISPTPTPSPSLRSSDTPSPLYSSNSRGSGVASGYHECDVCGNMLFIGDGTFHPHSGNDYRTIEFPPSFYNNGALNLDLVRIHAQFQDLITRRAITQNPTRVGPDPPTDLFQAVLDKVAKKYVVFDDYRFDVTDSYLWDDYTGDTIITVHSAKEYIIPLDTPPVVNTTSTPTVAPTFSSLRPSRAPTMVPQSGIEVVGVVDSTDVHHLTTFHDENTDWHADFLHEKDESFYCADAGDASLANFFNRPLSIYSVRWGGPGTNSFNFDPWSLFFDNPRVSNRIANYRNLRCNLKLKILVNGTPFDYGRAIVHYAPLASQDNFVFPGVGSVVDPIVMYSQRLHVYVDPTTSQGGTITLPYFWPNSSLNVPKREWSQMGRIYFDTIESLRNCNGVNDPVNITFFAWAEDVVLSCATESEPVGLLPQAGDEYGDGIISRPAAILARVAGSLTHVPYVRRYATAAEVGAERVGSVAKFFGLSKPNLVSDVVYTKRTEAAHLANVDAHDPIQKLSLDSKQTVTIDPRVTGLCGEDETGIVSIAQRESYLTKFHWLQTQTSNTMLFSIMVAPCVWSPSPTPRAGGRIDIAMPPCCAMTLPFGYWRGSMRYRFQIVKSSFHRGRLRFVYEPGVSPGVVAEYNTNLSEIVDIGQHTDFCVDVGWHHTGQYLRVMSPGVVPVTTIYKKATTGAYPNIVNAPILAPLSLDNVANGYLSVYVVNELECPAPAATVLNPIAILVSVSACEDFEVFQPTDTLDGYTYLPQMGAEQVLKDPERAHPVAPPLMATFGKRLSPTDKTALICHGDPVVSIRSLLKRYVVCDYYSPGQFGATAAQSQWLLQMSAFPIYRGKHPFGRHLVGTVASNISHMSHINYFTPMFHGRRGGIRNKFVMTGLDVLTAKRIVKTNLPTYVNVLQPSGSGSTASALAFGRTQNNFSGWTGVCMNTLANGTFEAEVPYSAQERFRPARNVLGPELQDDYPIRLESLLARGADPSSIVLDRYVSAADDYSLYWFAGIPVITYLPTRLLTS